MPDPEPVLIASPLEVGHPRTLAPGRLRILHDTARLPQPRWVRDHNAPLFTRTQQQAT